jgi:hypothetical protein
MLASGTGAAVVPADSMPKEAPLSEFWQALANRMATIVAKQKRNCFMDWILGIDAAGRKKDIRKARNYSP